MKKLLSIAVCLQIAFLSLNANAFGTNISLFEFENANLLIVTSSEDLLPGKSEKFKKELTPGKYVYTVDANSDGISIGILDRYKGNMGTADVECWEADEYVDEQCFAEVKFEVSSTQTFTFIINNTSKEKRRYIWKVEKGY